MNSIKTALLGSLLLTYLLMNGAIAATTDALEEVPSTEKLIRVRSSASQPTNRDALASGSDSFNLQVSTENKSYGVNKAIYFKVKSNRSMYLYLFNIDPQTGKGLLIFPNQLQTNNQINANDWTLVPKKEVEFYSDRSGTERIIFVASERNLDVNRLNNLSQSKSLGDFYDMEAPLDAFDTLIGETYNSEKKIGIRQSNTQLPKGLVVKEVNLRIR